MGIHDLIGFLPYPILETLRIVSDLLSLWCIGLALQESLIDLCHLILRHEDRGTYTEALGMPSFKDKILWIVPLELITDILDLMILRWLDMLTEDEIHPLPS